MSIDASGSLRTIRTLTKPRKSIASVQSFTSVADTLRGKKVPVTRFSQMSAARAERKAKKVEQLLKGNTSSHAKYQTSSYERNILNELDNWCEPRDKFKDNADISLHPSYDILSYDLNCYVRYLDNKDKYNRQFVREMAQYVANQPNICDEYYLKRMLCYKTPWPPLHTKRELKIFVSKFCQLSPSEKQRVDYLMNTDMSLGS